MGFWRRQQRSIRKRVVRLVHGEEPFVTDYLGADFRVRLDNIMGREIAYRSSSAIALKISSPCARTRSLTSSWTSAPIAASMLAFS
jgi:hypothetical protein